MSVTYVSNTANVRFHTERYASLGIRFMLEDVRREARPITPKQHGFLRDHVNIQVQGLTGTIMWHQIYALYQEKGRTHGRKMKNYTTPGTGPGFALTSVTKVVDNSEEYFNRASMLIPKVGINR